MRATSSVGQVGEGGGEPLRCGRRGAAPRASSPAGVRLSSTTRASCGIAAAVHQPLVDQPGDQRAHRRLADALGGGELGEPGRARSSRSRVRVAAAVRLNPSRRVVSGAEPEDEVLEVGDEPVGVHTNSCTTQLCIWPADRQNHDGNHIRSSHSAWDSGWPVSTG